MQRFFSKNLFWILQFLGWGAFSLFLAFVANLSENWKGILVITIGNMVVFIAMSSLLRWILNKVAPLENFKPIMLVKIVVAVFIAAMLMPTVTYYVGYGVGKFAKLVFVDSKEIFNKPPTEPNAYGKYIIYSIILGGWTIFFYIIKLIRNSNDERIRRLRLKDQVKQAQLNTLKGHINPQFIFTALTNIKSLMLEDVKQARAMLTTLSELLRYSLTKTDINTVILDEEVVISKNYMDLLMIDNKKVLHTNYDLAPETLSIQVPPLLLPNLIELATRYGVLATKNEDTISLKSELKNQRLKISVLHTGTMTLSKPRQVLENTLKQRLKLLYGNEASFMSNHEIDTHTLWVVLPVKAITKPQA